MKKIFERRLLRSIGLQDFSEAVDNSKDPKFERQRGGGTERSVADNRQTESVHIEYGEAGYV